MWQWWLREGKGSRDNIHSNPPCTSLPLIWISGIAIAQGEVRKANKKLLKTSSISRAFYVPSMWIFIIIELEIPMSFVIFRSVISSLWDLLLAVQAWAQFNHIWFIAHWFFSSNRCKWTLIGVRALQFNCWVTACGASKLKAGDYWGLS